VNIEIRLEGEPHAQQRHRARRVGSVGIRTYDNPRSADWKKRARLEMLSQLPIDGPKPVFRSGVPLRVMITAHFECPKGERRKRQPRLFRWHTKKSDADNIAKAVLDAANGILWHDDAQIAQLLVTKMVAAQDTAPCVLVDVRELPDQPRYVSGEYRFP
jgi:Holliday junction resolvase RusA-like endonuclease